MASGPSPHYDYERDCEPWEHRRKEGVTVEIDRFIASLRSYDEGGEPADGWYVAYDDLQRCASELERLTTEVSDLNSQNVELRKEMDISTDKFRQLHTEVMKLQPVYDLVTMLTHMCGGRDCVGFRLPLSGSGYRCGSCEAMRVALGIVSGKQS